jgi:precorrin-6B methylase 2
MNQRYVFTEHFESQMTAIERQAEVIEVALENLHKFGVGTDRIISCNSSASRHFNCGKVAVSITFY